VNFEKCTKERIDKFIVVSEQGRKFTIQNDDKILVKQVQVDACLINDYRIRCDYLFEIEKKFLVIYLELKGKHIDKAYEQLVATIGYCLKRHENFEKKCYVVASRVPRMTPKIQNLKQKIRQKYEAELFLSTQNGKISV